MTGARRKIARTAVAVLFALPFVVASITPSGAAPSQADVAAAKAKLDALNQQMDLVAEQYLQARVSLQQVQAKLTGAKHEMEASASEAAAARAQLGERAAEAYTGMGSQLDTLLGAQSFSQFSDRLEFMGALAQSDADLATAADASRQRAEWAAQQYDTAVTQAQTQLDAVNNKRDQISGMISEAQTLYEQTNQGYQSFLAAQAAAMRAQQAQDQAAAGGDTGGSGTTGGDTGGTGGTGGGTYNPPPPNVTGAARAIDAAKQELGATYVWGTAGPDTYDCSGLTSWAWAQAGVYLPHSSQAQYDALPHVASMAEAQPGDLLFFYSPISHVALYMGGGMMIHARHPGPGGEVQTGSVAGYGTPVVGIARP
jgi:cell wall-associated NlpC family hydrolase